MGIYVYRVTKDIVRVGDKVAHIAKFAYKPYWNDQQANRKMHFKTGCYSKPKLKGAYIALVGEDRIYLYENSNMATWFYDSDLGGQSLKAVD